MYDIFHIQKLISNYCVKRCLQFRHFQFRKLNTATTYKKDNNGKTLKPEYQVTREAYLAFERDWENKVDYSKLSEREKLIHLKHKEAIEDFHWTYIDPESGNKAITRFRHYLKKTCCGNACRHCIYNHEQVRIDIYVLGIKIRKLKMDLNIISISIGCRNNH